MFTSFLHVYPVISDKSGCGGLSSEPKAHLLILRGAARLAEGGKGESEDIYGAEAVEILPRSLW